MPTLAPPCLLCCKRNRNIHCKQTARHLLFSLLDSSINSPPYTIKLVWWLFICSSIYIICFVRSIKGLQGLCTIQCCGMISKWTLHVVWKVKSLLLAAKRHVPDGAILCNHAVGCSINIAMWLTPLNSGDLATHWGVLVLPPTTSCSCHRDM